MISLYPHQKEAIDKLKNGSILCASVGTGKSRTALAYYYSKECGGDVLTLGPLKNPKNLYIITTARKRDTHEWEEECRPFGLYSSKEHSVNNVSVIIDSWNNVSKYCNVCDAFFIFDEQRVVGSGAWVKAFLAICKKNRWILLTATPGDTWLDFIPVFIANGFYKNRTEFIRQHVIYSRYTKYPKVERYVGTKRLISLKESILVNMDYTKKTIAHEQEIIVGYDKKNFKRVLKERWDIFKDEPIRNASSLCYLLRKVCNTSNERIEALKELVEVNKKVIIFYNFDYELDILREVSNELDIPRAEWNGHIHQPIPNKPRWMYLVQYFSGAEGWNCTDTNVMIFYSQNYSYKTTVQAAGRIDRLNTPYADLYYYHLRSSSGIDLAIKKAFLQKKDFNEKRYLSKF